MTCPIHVLHVDDEPGLGDMVAAFLKRYNDRFITHTAVSPDDGDALLATEDIDCIVSDYQMPGRSGLDFLEDIREEHPKLPFILYTGKGSEEVASMAMSKGATDYVQKERCSDHYELLANAIENSVSKYRAERHAETMERRYRALFEQSEAAIAWLEYQRDSPIIRDINPTFRTMFCASGEEIVGDNLDDVVAPHDDSTEAKALSQKVCSGQSINGIVARETTDGSRRIQVQVIPVPSPNNGAITHAFAIYSDVDLPRLEQ